ncbi:dihydrofolate reductase [Linnemannia zychae]|nr:dihydrofolate reductase [Linnemannia zychae]
MRAFSIVVAADRAMGIGKNGGLPWRLRKDMAFFAKITGKVVRPEQAVTMTETTPSTIHQRVNACIMGRKTWESIPKKFRPLSDRFNVIVSRDPHYLDDKPEKNNPLVALAKSFEAALDLVESLQTSSSSSSSPIQIARIFLIGGAQLYNEGVRSKDCAHIFMTKIDAIVDCDTFFPEIDPTEYTLLSSAKSHSFLEEFIQEPVEGGVIEEGGYQYEYTVYNRSNV